jgi:two-component system CheB/CheR fusion protein
MTPNPAEPNSTPQAPAIEAATQAAGKTSILRPAALAHEQPGVRREDPGAHLHAITALLRAKVGHDFDQYKGKALERRIQRRIRALGLEAVPDYIARLRQDPAEVDVLFREVLIGVTGFFRDPDAFAALRDKALPALLGEPDSSATLRVWVPGCSTGEEAYSIAITIREAMARQGRASSVLIFATDIDDRAIAVARAGRYPDPLVGVSDERKTRWFTHDGNDWRVGNAVRDMCVFSVHSATRDPPFSQLDLVSCRNLLIYLNAELQQRLVRMFHHALRPGGFLLLGPAESVARNASLFTAVDRKQRLYLRRDDARCGIAPRVAAQAGRGGRAARSALRGPASDDIERSVRGVLERFSPVYVVIDANHDILRFSGDTGRYLGPSAGVASLNLFSLLHRGLRGAARELIRQASSQRCTVVREGLGITLHGVRQPLRLIAAPLGDAEATRGLCVLAFDELERAPAEADTAGAPASANARVAAMARELEHTRLELQAAIDQQDIATEELRSVNEQLQASNAELEASKEEMQSINEELQTINAEILSKNESLSRLNSDLSNLMESTQIATLFLDADLRVTGFTSGVTAVFHLREGDRGRSILEIASRVSYPQLQDDVRHVLRTLGPVERVLRGSHGVPSYLLRMRPYRTVENVIEGAVLTFVDITEREAHEAERARLASIVEWSRDAIVGYAPDGTITSWNAGAERALGYPAAQILGRSLAVLLPGETREHLQPLLEVCTRPDGAAQFETTWRHRDGTPIAIELSCAAVKDPVGKVVAGSAIARDVSKRRRDELALRQSELRLHAILEQTSMGLAQTNFEGRFELVNPRFCEIVGRTARELYRMRVQDIIHPDDLEKNIQLVRSLLVERSHFDLDIRMLRPDGSVVWTNHSVTVMLDHGRRPQHLISAVLDITQQKRASQHIELMLDELNHRVKNTLATVQAIAQQTLAKSRSLDEFRIAFNARLMALSMTHNLLAADAWTGARLHDIVAAELAPYLREDEPGHDRARIEGEELLLTPKVALALSMAIHELATNASKYGALSSPSGQVTVRWRTRDEQGQRRLNLQWIESGGPPVVPPTRRGFGTRLITEGLTFELDGEATLDYAETGLSCVIDVTLSEARP